MISTWPIVPKMLEITWNIFLLSFSIIAIITIILLFVGFLINVFGLENYAKQSKKK